MLTHSLFVRTYLWHEACTPQANDACNALNHRARDTAHRRVNDHVLVLPPRVSVRDRRRVNVSARLLHRPRRLRVRRMLPRCGCARVLRESDRDRARPTRPMLVGAGAVAV